MKYIILVIILFPLHVIASEPCEYVSHLSDRLSVDDLVGGEVTLGDMVSSMIQSEKNFLDSFSNRAQVEEGDLREQRRIVATIKFRKFLNSTFCILNQLESGDTIYEYRIEEDDFFDSGFAVVRDENIISYVRSDSFLLPSTIKGDVGIKK